MKKQALGFFLLITAISFASAQGISEILSAFDPSDVVLSSVFIVEFALIFFALQKFFKSNTTIAAVVSAAISFFTVYFIQQNGFDFSGFLFNVGISSDTIMTVVPIIILAGVIFTIIKLKAGSLFVFGGLLILLSFFVYEQTIILVLGIILVFVGFFFIPKNKNNAEKRRTA